MNYEMKNVEESVAQMHYNGSSTNGSLINRDKTRNRREPYQTPELFGKDCEVVPSATKEVVLTERKSRTGGGGNQKGAAEVKTIPHWVRSVRGTEICTKDTVHVKSDHW